MNCPVCQIELKEILIPYDSFAKMYRDCSQIGNHFLSTWINGKIISYYFSWIDENEVEYNLRGYTLNNRTEISDEEENLIFECESFFPNPSIELLKRLLKLKAFS